MAHNLTSVSSGKNTALSLRMFSADTGVRTHPMYGNDYQELSRNLKSIDDARVRDHNKLAAEVQKLSQRQLEVVAQEQIKAVKEVVTHSYGRAAAYTNLIMVAGYAAFFAMWSSVKDDLSHFLMLWAGLLMTMSAFLFVIAEVHKMLTTTRLFRRVHKKLLAEPSPTLVQDIQSTEQEHERKMFWSWVVIFIPSLLTGVVAAALLLISFAREIIVEMLK